MVNSTEVPTLNTNQQEMHWSVVGTLIYLCTRTQPYLVVVAGMLASNLIEPLNKLLIGAKYVLLYLNGTSYYELKVKPDDGIQLTVAVDASWWIDLEKGKRSRSGMFLMYENSVVAAITNLQKNRQHEFNNGLVHRIVRSIKTIVWLRNVLSELQFEQGSTRDCQHKEGCIRWANGGARKHFNRRKLIEIRHNYVMSLLKDSVTLLVPTRTVEVRANSRTNVLISGELSRAISITWTFISKNLWQPKTLAVMVQRWELKSSKIIFLKEHNLCWWSDRFRCVF